MGLFDNLFERKECDICGGKVGLLGGTKVKDGRLCKECAGKLSPHLTGLKNLTLDDIKEHLAYREENAEKVKAFIDDGGTFICWLVGHEHADDLHVLEDYGNQLVITLPTLTTRALQLFPSPDEDAYNYNVMTYFVVDSKNKTIKMMRIGADIDMHGIRHQGVSLNYETGELVATW